MRLARKKILTKSKGKIVKDTITYLVLKCVIDIVDSLVGIILTLLIMLIIVVLIKLEDAKSPVLLIQEGND